MNEQIQEIIKCKESFPYFCANYVKVYNPELGLTPFKLYPFQSEKVFPMFESERFVICKKFRQAGLSTVAAIWCLWKALFFVDLRMLIISQTDREAMNLMAMIKIAWENIPDWMKCKTEKMDAHVMQLETGAIIRCGTPKLGRSFSANVVIIDEAAFVPKMYDVWKGIFPTLSAGGKKGKAFVISTVNGLGNWYADTYHDALDRKNDFKVLDLEYTEHPNYNNPNYVQMMKEQLGPKGYDQEVLGIFLSGSGTFIPPETIRKIKPTIKEDQSDVVRKLHGDKLWIYKAPVKGRTYILCADVAEGLGQEHDYSTFHILDTTTLEQCAEYCNNEIGTFEFAKVIDEVGKYYNRALAIVEGNALGQSVLMRLHNDLEYENIYWSRISRRKTKIGFYMTQKTRPLVLNTFSNFVESGSLKIHSPRLLHEIQTFEFNPRTHRAEARHGRHDDLVMAISIGVYVRNFMLSQSGSVMSQPVIQDEYDPGFDPKYETELENDYEPDPPATPEPEEVEFNYFDVTHRNEGELGIMKEFGWWG